ncbi:MAG: hypothetical protein EOO53_14250 [Gammaproteobacteria bacterium]|nr:MAG: hypothetical protein EOO53_14250 [Gammaproteobacteria bacterium]
MKYFSLLISILISVYAGAEEASQEDLLVGKWQISPDWRQKFEPACRSITMEITSDHTIIRRTGELEYISNVTFIPDGQRLSLREILISHNGKPSCSGISAESILKHLNQLSFAKVTFNELSYYKNASKESLIVFTKM